MYGRKGSWAGDRSEYWLCFARPCSGSRGSGGRRRAAAVLVLGLSSRRADGGLLFRRLRHGLGPAVRLRRRGQFRSDFPDRPRRLHRRHPQQQLRLADPGLRRRRSIGGGGRRHPARRSGVAAARPLFRLGDARRRAAAAEFRRHLRRRHRRRNRHDRARRAVDRCEHQLLVCARLPGSVAPCCCSACRARRSA